jgi:CRISPR-associated protein Csb1
VPRAAAISGAVQTSVLSCSGLRNLSFPDAAGEITAERNQAGQAVLAALGLFGLIAQNEAGYLLRSRCELIPRTAGQLELIGRTLEEAQAVHLDSDGACKLLADACAHAEGFGLKFRDHVLRLQADDRLVELVKRSRDAAAKGDSEPEA